MDATSARSRSKTRKSSHGDGDSILHMDSNETLMKMRSVQTDGSPNWPKDDDKYAESRATTQGQGLQGDKGSIALLTFLYVLQGIPIGLGASLPMILQNRKVTYKQQAMFSLVFWPFSLKLLWAPFVDSCYSTWMGRRKTWLVPTQYLIGFFMLFLSGMVDSLLGGDGVAPNVLVLTIVFFMLDFLAATQDIAVDGWALTMLSRRNVGYASTCNCVGQTAGYFLGNVVFLALESAEFCNKYLRSVPQNEGVTTLSGFLYFWGWVFMITTTCVWIMKKERASTNSSADGEPDMGIVQTYQTLWKIVRLPNMQLFAAILLTTKIGFAAADSVSGLKLIEGGVTKDKMALMAVPMVPLQIILPLVISKYTAGPRPMDVFLKAMPYRLVFGLVAAVLVWWTPIMHLGHGEFPLSYYAVLLLCYAFHQVTLYSMFVAIMAFNARVSDPGIGGTYMTLLNTLSNLGGNWPSTLALWLVDSLTFQTCNQVPDTASCNATVIAQGACKNTITSCVTDLDGFYIESVLCVIIGLLWFRWGSGKIRYLQRLNLDAWKVS